MPITLIDPIIVTTTATTIQITDFLNKIEDEKIEIKYKILLDDGSLYKRDSTYVKGYDAVKAVYAELDVILSTGKTFEEASTELLYNKITQDQPSTLSTNSTESVEV